MIERLIQNLDFRQIAQPAWSNPHETGGLGPLPGRPETSLALGAAALGFQDDAIVQLERTFYAGTLPEEVLRALPREIRR